MVRLLQLHSGSITYFNSILYLTDSDACIIEQSVLILGNLGVKTYFLEFSELTSSEYSFSFPPHLSFMPCLKCFSLMSCNLHPSLKTSCDSMQTPVLADVKLVLSSLECILSSCLSLRSVYLISCEFACTKLHIGGADLRLEYLQMHGSSGVSEIEFHVSNLNTMDFYNTKNMVKLIFNYVPQLQNLILPLCNGSFRKNIVSYLFGQLGNELPHKNLVFGHTWRFKSGTY